jgi:hypothetical protein
MFEQTSRLAERLASSVSRRGFLGSLGGWAAAAAMGMAGIMTGTGTARAGDVTGACCAYRAQPQGLPTYLVFFPGATSCPDTCCGSPLLPGNTFGQTCNKCHTKCCNGCPGGAGCSRCVAH